MKAFLKQIVASFFGSCFSVGALVIFTFFGFFTLLGLLVSSVSESVEAKLGGNTKVDGPQTGSVLVIDLSRGFSDAPTFSPANTPSLFSGGEKGAYGLLDTLHALETAAGDDAISAVLLLGGNLSGTTGFASASELRATLMRFRGESKKPVFAYLPSPTYKDYLLSTAADEVWLHPLSELPLNGLSSTGIYFKNLLDNLGIGVQITRVGTHKSAVEPLISDKMSPEDRAQRTQLTRDLWTLSLQYIFASRSGKIESENEKDLLAQNFTAVIDHQGYISAREAVEKKFVDAALYEDEMIERIKTVAETDEITHSFRQISLDDYLRAREISVEPPVALSAIAPALNASLEWKPSIAVVYAEGEIVDGWGAPDEVGGAWFSRALRELRNDASVKAVVLRINSPGGSVFASEQIRREAELLAEEKTLVVSMGDIAASGGYWISTPAKKIFAEPATITGSIGVFGVIFNLENLGKQIGVNTDAVLTAPFAEIDTLRRPKTPQEMALIQKSTDRIYADFLKLVADARGMSVEAVNEVAQGQVWGGVSAKNKNLIDEFGGLLNAIEFAKKEAGLGDEAPVISIPGAVNRYQELFDRLNDVNVPVASANAAEHALCGNNPALRAVARNLRRVAQRLRAFNDPNHIYARLPFDIDSK